MKSFIVSDFEHIEDIQWDLGHFEITGGFKVRGVGEVALPDELAEVVTAYLAEILQGERDWEDTLRSLPCPWYEPL